MSFVEVIARKRDGGSLSRRDIGEFVRGATAGSVPVEQLSALLMAICCRGMNAEEIAWLTEEMLDSGERWELARDLPAVVDKHSTGGVGDTVSLILAPLLAAVGVPVAMMAGRGLGHSQGTLDKLAAIPGFECRRDRAELLHLLDACGAAIIAQTEEIAPADRILYALRDVTGTVPSLGLIVASIMSKKLALGAGSLILDVKWGSGAFRKAVADAVELGAALRQVARTGGMACEALITDMNQPLGAAIGTALEVRAAIDVLEGGGDPLLREAALRLCEEAMVLGGRSRDPARASLEGALADGGALTSWQRLVEAHGGGPEPRRLPGPQRSFAVVSEAAGYVSEIRTDTLGWVATDLGAGRRARDEEIAHGAGLVVQARIGDRLEAGQPVAMVHVGERPVDDASLAGRVRAAFRLAPEPVAPPALILGTVDDVTA